MLIKLKKLWIPFLAILLGTLALSSFIHYVLVIKLGWLPLSHMQVEFLPPLLLAFAGALLFLQPRIKRWLEFNRDDGAFLMALVASVGIMAPTMVAQNWIGKAASELKDVPDLTALASLGPRDHARLATHFIDKGHPGLETYVHTSGRYDDQLNFDLFFVMPIRTDEDDTLGPVVAWWGRKFHYSMSTSASEEDKSQAYNAHFRRSAQELEEGDLDRFDHLENLHADDHWTEYEKAVRSSDAFHDAGPIRVFAPHNEPFEARDADMPGYFGLTSALALLGWLIALAFPAVRNEDQASREASRLGKDDGPWSSFKAMVFPREGFFTTPILIWANLLLFLAMVIAGLGFFDFPAQELIGWGANYGPETTTSTGWWRLFTSMFLHGGFVHLFANMYGLLFAGLFLEPVLGRWRVLTFYVVSGLIASVVSVMWHPDSVGVGASGAIFGLYGVLIGLIVTGVFERDAAKGLLVSMLIFVGYNLLMGLRGNVDNAAHIGGLVAGLVIGLVTGFVMPKAKDVSDG